MKRNIRILLVLTLVLGFTLDFVSQVFAQETKKEEFTLEEITVTAQKREEDQQKVPIAMEVITAEDIEGLGKTNIDEILTSVSSAIVQKAADGYRVSLRGISDDSSAYLGQSMATPTVAINADGVYSNRKDTAGSLYDLERVEVLYGPQSTMYSSNSPGGIVNVITASPKLDKYEVSGSVEGGNYNLLNLQGALNVPAGEKVAFRASVHTSKRDSYMTGGGDDENSKSGRLRALYQPSEKLSFMVTGEYSKDKGAGFGGGVDAFDTQDGYYTDGTKVTDPWTAKSDGSLSYNNQTSKKIFLNMNLDMGSIGTLTFVPSYATRNGDNAISNFDAVQYGQQSVKEKSVELRMTSAADFIFKWILGANYYKSSDENNMRSAEYILNNGTIGDYTFRRNNENAKAVFANVTYPIIDTLRITGGIRKSWDDMVTDNFERKGDDIFFQPGTIQSSEGRPDYKIGFEYDLGTNSMLYGDYATSYRVQGMNMTTKLQELEAFSFGAKSRFFGNKLQLNASSYYYIYRNYAVSWIEELWQDDNGDHQIQKGKAKLGQANEIKFDSGTEDVLGAGRMIGLDISAIAVMTAKDKVNLTISYIKSEWTDLCFHWQYPTEDLLIDGVFYDDVPHPDSNYNGKPMTNTPPWTINLSYDHNFNLWNGGVFKVGVNCKYQTAYQLSWQEDWRPWNYQESHFMENAKMAYNDPTGKWSLSAYANNISNYAEKRLYMNAGGIGVLMLGDPRTYGAVLSVRF